MTLSLSKQTSLKAQSIASLLGIASCVIIPQMFHLIGKISGLGISLGEILLPMHLPVIFVGLISGPLAGFLSGFFGPLVSSMTTGMPGPVMLPFMIVELASYGLMAGLLKNVKMSFPGSVLVKILAVQIFGRVMRTIALAIAIYFFDRKGLKLWGLWKTVHVGLFGLLLQFTFIPLLLYRLENLKNKEKTELTDSENMEM